MDPPAVPGVDFDLAPIGTCLPDVDPTLPPLGGIIDEVPTLPPLGGIIDEVPTLPPLGGIIDEVPTLPPLGGIIGDLPPLEPGIIGLPPIEPGFIGLPDLPPIVLGSLSNTASVMCPSVDPDPIWLGGTDPNPIEIDAPGIPGVNLSPAGAVIDPPAVNGIKVTPNAISFDAPPVAGINMSPPAQNIDAPRLPGATAAPPPIFVDAPPVGGINVIAPPVSVDGPPVGGIDFMAPPVSVDAPPVGGIDFMAPPVSVDAPPVGGIDLIAPPVSVDAPPVGGIDIMAPPVAIDAPPVGPISTQAPPIAVIAPTLGPVTIDPPAPCSAGDPAAAAPDPCRVPLVDAPPITIDPPNTCGGIATSQSTGVDPSTCGTIDPAPVATIDPQVATQAIDDVYNRVCEEADAATCGANKIDDLVRTVCSTTTGSGDASTCADTLVGEVLSALEDTCGPDVFLMASGCLEGIQEALDRLTTELCPANLAPDCQPPTIPLPELPPLHILEPDHYDEQDCQLMPETEEPDAPWQSYCAPSDDEPGDPPEDGTETQSWETLSGFSGPYYATELTAQSAVLLSESLTIDDSGNWQAWGLVRNESVNDISAVVSASLFGSDGSLLARPTEPVQVDTLRPGEPGPFALTSNVDASQVARVEWDIKSIDIEVDAHRDFQILQAWSAPYGAREPIDLVYSDPLAGTPYPFVFAGTVDNLGRVSSSPKIVTAWLDQSDRVRWVATAKAGEIPFNADQAVTFSEVVGPRDAPPFFITVDDATVGPEMVGLRPMLWATGS